MSDHHFFPTLLILSILMTLLSQSGFSANASQRLTANDFIYLGAFRLPGDDTPPRTFAYGGNAMTFNPDGDPGNNDAYPGSLFVMGHDRIAGELLNGNQIAEITIPEPVIARNLTDLPQARFIQGFHEALAGYFHEMDEIPKVGMAYLNHPATGPKIHLTWGQHLQPENVPSQAWFNPTLATPNFQGVWFIGHQNLYSINGYLFEIPAAWADLYAQGRRLATGRMRDGGQGGMGPTLFAYRPWQDNGSAPPSGTRLMETPLLLYENAYATDQIVRAMNGYQHPDEWEGGAWITTTSGQSAVLFAGTKSNGAKYWYGYIHARGPEYPCVDSQVTDFVTCRLANGAACPAEDFAGCCDAAQGNCASYRGWWSTRFDAQFILYDPADLARVASGEWASWQPQPYASLDIDRYLYLDPPAWDVMVVGTGDQRRYRLRDIAYDRAHDLLYVLEDLADGGKPVVHVWRVGGATPSANVAVEFYHAGKNHYFNTANADDIAFLEANVQSGWFKTGFTFPVYPLDSLWAETVAVARFYGGQQMDGSFKPDSHFYTGLEDEIQLLNGGYQQACPQGQGSCVGEAWFFEKYEYRVRLPSDGICSSETRPVYRFYNRGFPSEDSNHRYTIDTGVAAEMRAQGWADEGVKMCVPASG
ncbi:MAG: hypothetical protein H6974_01850 [Gammaproteobacteria bacterium]|nr:hypothetical protein [Gammaproteobacteria bacterium]